jgi:dUTP pyrophosphatase
MSNNAKSEGLKKTMFGDIPVIPRIIIEKLRDGAVIPKYASEGDSGMDVYATEDMLIAPGETKLIKLGFKMEIPQHHFHELGYRWECQARPRSGVSLKTPLRVANAPGTIDNFYRDEVGIILTNTADLTYGIASDTEDIDIGAASSDYVMNLKGNYELNEIPAIDSTCVVAEDTCVIHKGDRIAQLVFVEVVRPLEIVEGEVSVAESRGGGFGSTGV